MKHYVPGAYVVLVRLQVLVSVMMEIPTFWDVTLCSLVNVTGVTSL
jgi:hypothetical protein